MIDRVIKNKYRLIRRIGRGGMGSVYEVEHELLGVRRALKQLSTDLQGNPDLQRRFLIEAQTMAQLDHPNIVRVYDVDFDPEFGAYILMELIHGEDLGKYTAHSGKLPYDETARIGIAVASALACAHRNNVVHRDIKPGNILIEEGSFRPVVTDFGIAKRLEAVEDSTMTRGFLGTVRYSSREQIRSDKGVPIDARADLYSLGVVLYEISTGRKFLEGRPESEIIALVGFQDGWRPTLEFEDPPPERFRRLIQDCLEPQRERRVASVAELIRGLEECRLACEVQGASAAPSEPWTASWQGSPASPSVGTTLSSLSQARTLDPAIAPQPVASARTRWLALLQTLRSSVDDQAAEFERLLKELIAGDLPREQFRQLDDMSQILHGVEAAEGAGNYQQAAAGLQGLSDRIERLNDGMRAALVDALMRTSKELSEAWRALFEDARDLVPVEESPGFFAILSAIEAGVADFAWQRCQESVREARGCLERARRTAATRGKEKVASGLRELEAGLAEIRVRGDASLAGDVSPTALAREADTALGAGLPGQAVRLVSDAVRRVRDALARIDEEDRGRAEFARARADEVRRRLSAEDCTVLGPNGLVATEDALQAAARASERGEHRNAAAAYEHAVTLLEAAIAEVDRRWDERLHGAEEALRAALARNRDAPEVVVGPACDRAQKVLAAGRGADRPRTANALAAALAALQAAEKVVPAFRDAEREAAAATAILARVAPLAENRADLRAIQGTLGEAHIAAARADFAAARAGFVLCREQLERLERDLVRGDEERLALLSADVARALEDLDHALLREHCAAELERVAAARQASDAQARDGNPRAALESLAAALPDLRAAEQKAAAVLHKQATALGAETERLLELAGPLLAAPLRDRLVERARESARAVGERTIRDTSRFVDESWALLDREQAAALRTAEGRVADGVEETRRLLDELRRNSADAAARCAVDADALAREAQPLLADDRVAEAVRRVDETRDAVRRALEHEVAHLQAAAEAARREADMLRAQIAADDACALVATDLVALDEALAGARRAYDRSASAEAARLYGVASERLRELQARMLRDAQARLDDERAALAERLAGAAGAPEEIVGRARTAARSLLDEAVPAGELLRAAVAMRSAREVLDRLLGEAEAYARACARREAARAAEEHALALHPSRRQVRAPSDQMRTATAAFARRSWAAAERAYGEAAAGFEALVAELEAAREKERVARKAEVDAAAARAAEQEEQRREREEKAAAQRQREAQKAAEAPARRREEERRLAAVAAQQRTAAEAAAATPLAREGDATVVPLADEDETRLAQPPHDAAARPSLLLAWMVGSLGLVAAITLGLWLALREPTAPVETASEEPAQRAPTAEDAAPAPPIGAAPPDEVRVTRAEPGAPPEGAAPGAEREVAPEARPAVPVKRARRVDGTEAAPATGERASDARPEAVAATEERSRDGEQAARIQLASAAPARDAAATPPDAGAEEAKSTGAVPRDGDPVVDAPPVEVASLPPSPAPAPPPLRLSGFSPGGTRIALREGAKQSFGIRIEGGAPGAKAKTVWRLEDRIVARDVERWSYAPGYDEASDAPRELAVQVTRGSETQRRTWQIEVENVNRTPTLSASPRTGRKIEAQLGDRVTLKAAVKDPDSDPITYSWKVDGEAVASDAAELEVPVTGDRSVSLRASDGAATVTASWQIAALKPVPPPPAPKQPRVEDVPAAPQAPDVPALVQSWLDQYRAALNAKDANAVGRLRGLSASEVERVRESFDALPDLKVTTSDVRVESLGGGRARLSYTREDRFTRPDTGLTDVKTTAVSQDFVSEGGTLRELRNVR